MGAGLGFQSEIFSQRLFIAVIWNIVLQTLLAVLFVLIIQIDLLHPVSWIASTISEIFGWKMLLNIILLGIISCFQAYVYGSYYMIPLPKYFTRFSMFLDLFSLQNIMFSVLYALSGYFTMGLYSSLAHSNYNILKKKCENYDGQCLIEESLFLQFGGMWMGLYYFLSTHIFGSTILLFPHIYQDKFQQIKLVINNVIASGFRNSITPAVYFCIFYTLWGNKPRSIVSDVYSIYLEDPPIDHVINLVKSGIWIGLWFYTSLFYISVYTMKTIFNIVLTEPMMFPIESENQLTLSNAIAQRSQFNGYLGAQDLKILSSTDFKRRKQLFTLSKPGGHPRNWNTLLEKCLLIINDFSHEIDTINGDVRPVDVENSSNKIKPNVTPPTMVYSPLLRNMATCTSNQIYELKDQNINKVDNTFSSIMKAELNSYILKLCQKPGFSYLFGELPDTKLKFLLIRAQPIIWTCEGLAFIVAASITEDTYGVVQSDLPLVISALTNLKSSLEKLSRMGIIPRKYMLNDIFAMKMKSALISAVKRSIYKIVMTFSKYIHEIPLNADVQLAIQPFLLCKEP